MANTTAEISHSQYATRRKELLQLVKQLRSIGAQADLDLPRIAVIGNQSAGKSSVVEAISGINVPRDAGTCTRCPMECRMSSSSSAPWSCQVSIRWEFDMNDKPLDKVSEVRFGSLITDKGDVELALRRAQAAVLNPSLPDTSFLACSMDELKNGARGNQKPLQFSRNVVCVDLEGPTLTDLNFIDMPENAEPEVVKLVEDLVISHIKGNCLILVALPMTDDIENQKALRLAHQVDREGRRTIGVMTKPDMLTIGSTKARDLWLDVIEGRRHSLTHGYYCTRQPDDAESSGGITSANARVAESTYFKETSPWSTSAHKHRFGTNNLISTLSTLLVQIIKDTLPNLRAETMKCLATCEQELAVLPKPIETEPATYMLGLVTSFVNDVERYVQGGPAAGRLIHENRAAFATFKQAIRRTAPNFRPYVNADPTTSHFQNFLGEGEDEGPEEGLLSDMQPFTLTDMQKHIQKSITRELPDNVPFQAKVALIASFQGTWESSTSQCFDTVRSSMLRVLFECINTKFQRYENLEAHIRVSISELVDRHYIGCGQFLQAILEAEQTPYTQNDHYLETCKDKWLAKYKDARAGRVDASLQPLAKRARVTGAERNHAANGSSASGLSDTSQLSKLPAPVQASNGPTSVFGTIQPSGQTNASAFGQSPRPFTFQSFAKSNPPTDGPVTFETPAKPITSKPPAPSTAVSSSNHAAPSPVQASSAPATPAQFASAAVITSVPHDLERINSVLALLAEVGYTGLNAEDLGKLNPPDEYETELHVMAEVRGYFQVSYKRVIDNVPSLIDLKFVKAITKELQNFLISNLGLGTTNANDRCGKYLAEDPNIVARRDELVSRKNRLEAVKIELQNFGL
ncbi:hypothetical protein PILCRDRAFT_485567 [Piloderma croceum F 1598]|uniref:GED domain-containing protein n=1 Tax=Piloderma croceum (strain F 1598) TaxID=765440 RepID=A0A0C3B7B7_PILCF|nr:hypothetical protein PILCRDRAFT_485567 [Piloderma croceum F 1598]